jgi:hypothetical protein
MERVQYEEVRTLARRGAVNQFPDEEIAGLLVGNVIVGAWGDNYRQTGNDTVVIRPAFLKGERAWFVRVVWHSVPPYSCSGLTEEHILSFEAGVALLLEHGAFAHLFEQE